MGIVNDIIDGAGGERRVEQAERTLYVKLKWAAGIITSIVIIFGAFAWAVALAGDTRWAKIEEVKAWDQHVLAAVHKATDGLRKQQLEDKVYEITVVPEGKRTDTQRAVLDRSVRQLNEIAGAKNNDPTSER